MTFSKLTPNFSVRNVKESVAFYRDILGFDLDIAVPGGTSSIENEVLQNKEYSAAMVKKDGVYIMFIERDEFERGAQAFKSDAQGASVLFYVDVSGIDELYSELKEKVEIVSDIKTKWYGMREFYIKDCDGYVLAFGEKE